MPLAKIETLKGIKHYYRKQVNTAMDHRPTSWTQEAIHVLQQCILVSCNTNQQVHTMPLVMVNSQWNTNLYVKSSWLWGDVDVGRDLCRGERRDLSACLYDM